MINVHSQSKIIKSLTTITTIALNDTQAKKVHSGCRIRFEMISIMRNEQFLNNSDTENTNKSTVCHVVCMVCR